MTSHWRHTGRTATRRRVAAALAGSSLLACADPQQPELWLDLTSPCARLVPEVRDPDVLPGWRIASLVLPHRGAATGYAIASQPSNASGFQHKVVRYPDGGATTLPESKGGDWLTLHAGAGEVWLMRHISFAVWRIDDGPRLVPVTDIEPAPVLEVQRTLVFIADTPYIWQMPRTLADGLAEFSLTAIDPDTLHLGSPQSFALLDECPADTSPEHCEALALSEQVAVLASTPASSPVSSVVVSLTAPVPHEDGSPPLRIFVVAVGFEPRSMPTSAELPWVIHRQIIASVQGYPIPIDPRATTAGDTKHNHVFFERTFAERAYFRYEHGISGSSTTQVLDSNISPQLLQAGARVLATMTTVKEIVGYSLSEHNGDDPWTPLFHYPLTAPAILSGVSDGELLLRYVGRSELLYLRCEPGQ